MSEDVTPGKQNPAGAGNRVTSNKHKEYTMDTIQMQNKRGEYVPAIPLPFYGFRKKCSCGAKFWTINGYNGHYAYEHILMGNKPL